MGREVRLAVQWTKTGDPVPHQRETAYSATYPLSEEDHEPWVIAAMALESRSYAYVLRLEGERESVDVDAVLAAVQDLVARQAANRIAKSDFEAQAREEHYGELRQWAEAGCPWQDRGTGLWGTEVCYVGVDGRIDHHGEYRRVTGEGHDLLQHRDPELLETITAALATQKAEAEELARARMERQAAIAVDEEARRVADAKRRKEEIAQWSAEHGSERLRTQLAQGHEGWPLYLHERLAAEFPGAVLDAGADNLDVVVNPTEEALAKEREVADALVATGQVEEAEKFRAVSVRWWSERGSERSPEAVVVCEYRPGSDAFDLKTVRITV